MNLAIGQRWEWNNSSNMIVEITSVGAYDADCTIVQSKKGPWLPGETTSFSITAFNNPRVHWAYLQGQDK